MATDKATLATATTKSENTKDAASTSNNNKNNKRPREEDSTPPASDIKSLLMPSLFRLTEGIPRRELKLMISESKACEALLEKEINELQESLKNKSNNNNSSKKSQVDIYLETEVTPPDRYFTVSSLLGRLRDDLATPLPPNSILPALRAQHGLLQQPPKKKKSLSNQSNNNDPLDVGSATSPEEPTDIEKQKRVLALLSNPEYTQEHPTPAALLTCWKKISTHRTSVVFRRPVNPKEAPGYTDRIFFPMDLSLVRKMIVARLIKSFSELHQRIGLICHNCVKYNGRYVELAVEDHAATNGLILFHLIPL